MARPRKAKPQTEVELTELQGRYMANPECKETLDTYFFLLKNYARSLLLKMIKRKGFYLQPERVDEVATDATLKLLAHYSKPDWKIWGSFAGELNWKIIEALYEHSDEETPLSLNMTIGKGDDAKELGECLDKIGAKYLFLRDGEDPQISFLKKTDVNFSILRDVLQEAFEVLTYREYILFLSYMLLRLRRPKARWASVSFKEIFLTNKEEEAFELLLLEIRNRISETRLM